MARSAVGVVLLNMGGPEDISGVEIYLESLLADPALIRLPFGRFWQRGFARLVARRRARRVREFYRQIGGGSPIRRITEAQARLLGLRLEARGHECAVAVAMRYAPPLTGEAVARLRERGVERLVALSLYPQFSRATTGSSVAELRRVLVGEGLSWPLRVIESIAGRPGYAKLLAETIRRAIDTLPEGLRGEAHLLFSAHGLPQSYVKRGDPYADQVRATVAGTLAAGRFPNRWTLSFQSRVGPAKWLQPYTDRTILRLGKDGVRALCLVPVSFVSDHIETLHEIDIKYRSMALRAGIEHFTRAEAFNTADEFVELLADLVEREMKEASWCAS